MQAETIRILLVEDSPTDQLLARSALAATDLKHDISVVSDGVEAMAYLTARGHFAGAPRPDLILLDLNLPRKDGREVLREVKSDEALRAIPVIVLTTSEAEADVQQAYSLHANCYIAKPVDFDEFKRAVQAVRDFWFSVARLPGRARPSVA